MSEKKGILFSCIFMIIILGIFLYDKSIKEKNEYQESELTINTQSDKIENEIYQYLANFDKNILEMMQVYDLKDGSITREQMIDVAIKYIISHSNIYQKEIRNDLPFYTYEKDNSSYFSTGYVEKSFLLDIVHRFFKVEELDLEEHPFYDVKKDMFALVAIYGDNSSYTTKELLNFQRLSSEEYLVSIAYQKNVNSNVNVVKIEYDIMRDSTTSGNKYYLKNIKLL